MAHVSLTNNLDLLVRQNDPREWRFAEAPAPDPAKLADGELLIAIERFGLSANNVTYAVLGKSPFINYADFFPSEEPGWGRVPVWGIGRVEASRNRELAEGARLYGYMPSARYTLLRPVHSNAFGFSVNRGALPAVYNEYMLTQSDPFYLPGHEEAMIVFRPLVLTSILLDDYIADGNAYFGAEAVVIASASSKTSFGLAYMLAKRNGRQIVGLTSKRNAAFVRGLGTYSHVVTYDRIGELPDTTAVFVDIAGDAGVRSAVRSRLGSKLKTTITVGLSHWEKAGDLGAPEPSAEPTQFFFAPAWVEQRRADWGPDKFARTVSAAWLDFMRGVEERVRIVRSDGKDAVAAIYKRMVDGDVAAEEAHALSLFEGAFAASKS